MTVANANCEISYTGNGVTTQFDFPYPVQATSDLVVSLDGALLTLGVDYTAVLLSSGASGARLTLTAAPASGKTLFMVRDIAVSQSTDFVAGMKIYEGVLETILDKLTMLVAYLFKRTVRLHDLDATLGPIYWPLKASRVGAVLTFDSNGDILMVPLSQLYATGAAPTYAQLPIMKHEGIAALKANSTSGINWYTAVASTIGGDESDPIVGKWNNNFWPIGGSMWAYVQATLNSALPGGFNALQLGVLQTQALTYRSTP